MTVLNQTPSKLKSTPVQRRAGGQPHTQETYRKPIAELSAPGGAGRGVGVMFSPRRDLGDGCAGRGFVESTMPDHGVAIWLGDIGRNA